MEENWQKPGEKHSEQGREPTTSSVKLNQVSWTDCYFVQECTKTEQRSIRETALISFVSLACRIKRNGCLLWLVSSYAPEGTPA